MTNFADVRLPGLDSLLGRIKKVEEDLKFLRSSRATVAKAEYPPGIIPPSALEQATAEPGLVNLTVTAFALNNTPTALLSAEVTVPAGFHSCVVNLTGRVCGVNSTALGAYLTAQVKVSGITGNAIAAHADATGAADDAATNVATFAAVLTGLSPGATFGIELDAWTDTSSWSSDPSNLADLTGLIVWFA